jgi:hypothetical protein
MKIIPLQGFEVMQTDARNSGDGFQGNDLLLPILAQVLIGWKVQDNLFWQVCEFCNRYGLTLVTRRKLTAQEWMEALFFSIGFRVAETEAFLKKLLKCPPPV